MMTKRLLCASLTQIHCFAPSRAAFCRRSFVSKVATEPTPSELSKHRAIITQNAILRMNKYAKSGGLQFTAAAEFVTRSFMELYEVTVCCSPNGEPFRAKLDPASKDESLLCFTSDESYMKWKQSSVDSIPFTMIHMPGYAVMQYAMACETPPFGIVVDMAVGLSLKQGYVRFATQYYAEAKQLDAIIRRKQTADGQNLLSLYQSQGPKAVDRCFDDFLNNGHGECVQFPDGSEYMQLFSTPLTYLNSHMDTPPAPGALGLSLPANDSFRPLSEHIQLMRERTGVKGFMFNPPHNIEDNMPMDFRYIYDLKDVWF
jgi:hypothetical protein